MFFGNKWLPLRENELGDKGRSLAVFAFSFVMLLLIC